MRGRNAPPVEDGLENRDPSAPPPPSQRCVFQMGENGAGEGGKGGRGCFTPKTSSSPSPRAGSDPSVSSGGGKKLSCSPQKINKNAARAPGGLRHRVSGTPKFSGVQLRLVSSIFSPPKEIKLLGRGLTPGKRLQTGEKQLRGGCQAGKGTLIRLTALFLGCRGGMQCCFSTGLGSPRPYLRSL